MQSHYCVHKLHGQSALITPPSSTHTLTHTHKATPTTHTIHGGGGRGCTIYDALADHPDDPADASAQGVPAGRGYTAPGRQGHPASGPGTVHNFAHVHRCIRLSLRSNKGFVAAPNGRRRNKATHTLAQKTKVLRSTPTNSPMLPNFRPDSIDLEGVTGSHHHQQQRQQQQRQHQHQRQRH